MKNQNLKPFNTLTESEQRKIASRGGVASGKSRRERRRLRDILCTLLEANKEDGSTLKEDIAFGLIQKAVNGDIKAIELVMSLIGEKPDKYTQSHTDGEMKNDPFHLL